MINAVALTRRTRHVEIVKCSATVASGQVVSIGGRCSEASALLRLFATLLRPDSGQLSIAGVDALARPLDARRHVAYASPDVPLPEGPTVREYLQFLARARRQDASRADAAMARFGLRRNELLHRLRSAARQQVRLAAVATCGTPVLLLDRPSAGLAEKDRNAVAEWIVEMRDAGAAIVISGADVLAGLEARPLNAPTEVLA